MMFFVGFLLFIVLVYAELIFLLSYGWKKLSNFSLPSKTDYSLFDFYITVVVPFKNEEKQLPNLLAYLQKQHYPKELFEVLFINDNSIDNGKKYIEDAIEKLGNYRFFDSEGEGKKNALKTAVDKSMGHLIVTIDADCQMGPNWLRAIASYYQQFRPKMIVGPVQIETKGIFAQLQSLEFMSLAASTAASLGWKRPIMANGANLAFERSLFYEWKDPLNMKEMSGDDLFLLHKVKQKYRLKIHYLKSPQAQVVTKAAHGIVSFFKQRKRWVSKSKSYTDTDTIAVAIIVLLANLALIGGTVLATIDHGFLHLLIFLFVLKSIPDFILLWKAGRFFKQRWLLIWFIPLQVVYPIYIAIAVLLGMVGNKKWA